MLTQEQNELLTRIEPGAPMGAMLREYWVPACRSAKVEGRGRPRAACACSARTSWPSAGLTAGRLHRRGMPHRCASMALARNEGDGLRCIFHGWKVSLDGKCVDTPTEPDEARRGLFASKVPVRQPSGARGRRPDLGLPWQAGEPAAHPGLRVHPPARTITSSRWRGSSGPTGLQGLEALLDSAHVGYLHSANLGSPTGRSIFRAESDYMLNNGAPVVRIRRAALRLPRRRPARPGPGQLRPRPRGGPAVSSPSSR